METFNPNSVSVVVVNYNAGSLLLECIESALVQASEVIVVDNASFDQSIDALKAKFKPEIAANQLKIVCSELNLGFAAGCNMGIQRASYPHILFLNPDSTLGHDALKIMLGGLSGSPDVGMVGGLLVDSVGKEQGGARRAVPTPWRSFVRAFGLNRFATRWPKLFFDFHLNKQPLPDSPIEVEAISGACMLVKRDAMEEVGCWDEGYFLHCEDLDWCMRFRQRGWKILFVPDARVVHALGACSSSRPVFVEWHKHKGMVLFYRKFFHHQYPGPLMWLVIMGVWMRFGAVAVWKTATKRL